MTDREQLLDELRDTTASVYYVPDIAVYRWERLPLTPDGEIEDDFFLSPDVAIEILSPRQSRRSQRTRCAWYVANGMGAGYNICASGMRP